jgi:hypothetical protein
MRFHGRRSEIKNRAEEKHSYSQAGLHFMTGDQIKNTADKKHSHSHSALDFMTKGQIKNRAVKEHSHSQSGWDFMAEDQKSKTELRRSTATHILDGISWQKIRDQKQSQGGAQPLTRWMGFHERRSEIKNRAEEEHSHSHAGWDFMAEDQRSKTELRRSTATHKLDGISWQKIRDQKQS